MALNNSFLTYSLVSAFFIFGTSGAFAWTSPAPSPTPAPSATTTTTSTAPISDGRPIDAQHCPNWVVESALGEQCDDGNCTNGDGCTFECKSESNSAAGAGTATMP